MTQLTLQLLGRPQLMRGGAPVALAQAKAVALLLYLAVNREAQRRERLVDLLWPESLPQAARKNMRNTLWAIGDALGHEALRQEGGALRLAPAVTVDVHALEDGLLLIESGDLRGLERAAAHYRGPLAEGLALHGAPELELWLAAERERLAAVCLRLLSRIIALDQQAGRWPGVIAHARRALGIDPLREPLHLALIEAHVRLGQRGEAARQYAALREALRRELDVAPLPETSARYEALLAESAARPPGPGDALAPPPTARTPAPASAAPLFVGRAAELATLDAECARAARGEARVVLVSGDLGMGKSQLWRTWLATRAPQAVVLATEALETSEPVPLSPLLTLFRQPGPARALLEPGSPLAPVWLAELARLLPELALAWPELPTPLTLAPAEERARLFQALAEALRLLARPLLILIIDDLHWADPSTLDWLVYLLSQLRAAPLLLVATARPQDTPERLTALSSAWQRQGQLRQLALPPLSAAEGAALLAALGGAGEPAQVTERVHQSGGNPYFLAELSRAGPGEPAHDLAALIRARLRTTVPAAAAQVLQAAAILGEELTFGAVQATSGRSEEEALDALDLLMAAGVLAEGEAGYRFVHPLVGSVVAGELSRTRRQFLHRRAAQALERAYPQREAVAGRLAAHFAAAGEPAQAARYAELAARHALALAGWAEATSYARQALALAPGPERELLLGEVLNFAGAEEAPAYLEAARAGFAAQADAVGEARACLQLARRAFLHGRLEEALAWLDRAPLAAAQQDEPCLGVEAQMLAAGVERQLGAEEAAEQLLARAAEVAHARGLTRLGALVAFERGNLLADRGDLDAARAAFEEALRGAGATDDAVLATIAHNNLAFRAIRAGELDEAGAHLAQAQGRAERYALGFLEQFLWSTAGELALARGALAEADAAFERAYAAAHTLGNPLQQANVRLNQADVALARGRREQARALVREARVLFGPASDRFIRAKLERAELLVEAQTAVRG